MLFSKLSLAIVVFAIALIVGAFALIRLRVASPAVHQNIPPNRESSSASSSEDRISFTKMMLFDGKAADGFPFTVQTYRSWDCVILRRRIELSKSGNKAKLKFKKEVGTAEEVIEHGLKLDAAGQPVGERAVLKFPKDEESRQIRIVWTDQSNLVSIESPSLDHALKLEAWLKSGQLRPASTPEIGKDLVFELITNTKGSTSKGIPFSERLFKSNGCVVLSSRVEYFDSEADAKKELALRLKDATEIVDENRSNQTFDDRTVAIFAPDLPSEVSHSAQVVWTNNGELHTIKSNSLPHTLAFESQTK